jgi:hypothetical protein
LLWAEKVTQMGKPEVRAELWRNTNQSEYLKEQDEDRTKY